MATLTSFDPALKQIYNSQYVESVTYEDRPMLGWIPKYEKFGGRNMPIVLLYANTQGRSADFSSAQSNVTDAKLEDFLLTRVSNHSLAHVDSETAEASSGDKYAFLAALKTELDAAMNALADDLETSLPRSGTGSIGVISSGSTVSNQTITLATVRDVNNFEVGMTLRASASDGGSLRTGEEVLAAVDRSTATLTATSAAWNTVITALATGDYLSVDGDGANNSTNVKISGFGAWCPSSAPSATAFFGVDRTADSRLYGTIHDGSGQSLIEEALIDGQSKAAEQGGKIDTCFIGHVQYRKLSKQLGAKKEYCQMSASGAKGMTASIAYRGIQVEGDKGPIKVVSANKMPATTAFMLDRRCWTFATLKKATRFNDVDGNTILRRGSADGIEARLVSRGNVGCKAPIWNANVTLPSA